MNGVGAALASGMLAGGLHALALRPGWSLVAWIALVPLLRFAARGSAHGVLTAALAYPLTLLALDVAPWLAPTLARYFALTPAGAWMLAASTVTLTALVYGMLLGGALLLRRRVAGRLGVVWCAATWAVWEPLRTAILPPFFPLSVLATSQVDSPLLQLAGVTGIAGVTFVVVMVNAAFAEPWSAPRGSRGRRLAAAAAAGTVAIGAATWGAARITDAPVGSEHPARVLLVDGAAANAAESTLDRYIAATIAQRDVRPALVVWPESTLSSDFASDGRAWARLSAFVDELGVALMTGGVGSAVDTGGRVERFNSVHFVRPRHGMLSYHKRLLVPFAESWPAMLGAPPPAIEPVDAGGELAVFGDGGFRVAPLICFEITSAPSVRELARRGAQAIVNVNNDVWFAGWTAPQQVWARVRAVESGLPVVRATNGGTSAVIDPFGRLLAAVHADGAPVVLASEIPVPVDTLYVRTGEWLVPACALVVLGGVVPWRRSVTGRRMGSRRCLP